MHRLLMAIAAVLTLSWAGTAEAQLRTWDEFQVFTNSDAATFDYVGWSVALDETTVAVGATGNEAAYLYQYDESVGEWVETMVTASDGIDGDNFGRAIAIDDDILVVGAPFWEDGGFPFTIGKAYIFRFDIDLGEWIEEGTVEVPSAGGGEQCGRSVAVADGRVVVGTLFEEEVYIYEYDDEEEEWVETQTLSEDEVGDTNFGYEVAIAGDLLVVSAFEQAVYVFRWDEDEEEWVEEQRLAPEEDLVDGWGYTVDTDGTKIIVAQGGPDSGSNSFNSAWVYYHDYDEEEWLVEQELTDPDDDVGTVDRWGSTVGIDGDVVVVGDKWEDVPLINVGSTSMFRFDEEAGEWLHEDTVRVATGLVSDQFGYDVAVAGDLVVVGAPFDDTETTSAGAAYLYTQDCDGNDIRDTTELEDDCNENEVPDHCDIANVRVRDIGHEDLEADDEFGSSLAVASGVMMVGVPERTSQGNGSAGSVFIYNLVDAQWEFQDEIWGDDPDPSDRFGITVAMDGPLAVIGARGADAPLSDQGVAFVYRYNTSSDEWEQETVLAADDAAASDWFGMAVDIDSNVIVVGAYRADPEDDKGEEVSGAGAAYVFRFEGGVWEQEAKLVASDRARFDEFGRSVSVSGSTILVGAPRNDEDGSSSGSVYVFRYEGGDWEEDQILVAEDASEGAQFGYSLDIEGEIALVGAPFESTEPPFESGAAYVFRYDVDSDTWLDGEKIVEPERDGGALFGNAVSIRDNLAVIGAPESQRFGAAYIFRYDDDSGEWTSNDAFVGTEDGDEFGLGDGARTGTSVAVTGFLVATGAPGIDADDEADAGAAHVKLDIDCNGNGVPDSCEIADGSIDDSNLNGIPDECEDTVTSSVAFLRGDADGSGNVSGIPDGLFLFRWQFGGGDDPPCADSADVDDDGEVNGLVDGLTVLRWQFGGEAKVPAPGPDECGPDPDGLDDGIGCEQTSDECQL